ncbi:MAG: nitronate monooxygenase [Leptolyngbya sp. SIO3F4]|nr:nitronate monooxygenase [Leptolyngbya sp. SIO3F4]
MIQTELTRLTGIDFPIIMAPMFLVSNEAMITAAIDEGILGVFPTLNFRNEGELETMLRQVRTHWEKQGQRGLYGVNLIVQRSNPLYKKHLEICVKEQVPFYITSLGNPREVIEQAHAYGGKVFCDVTNLEHARKVYEQGCDGFIAVGQGAGGHAGPNPLHLLVPSLKDAFPDKPVVAAGGIADGRGLASILMLGAAGASVGTRFIASHEAGVNDAYKNAVVESGMEDIVMTTKISGTPCTIINTPYAKKIGYKQNFMERFLSKNKRTRKYFKMWVQYMGMKKLERSVLPADYKTLWCAGQSVERIQSVISTHEIVDKFKSETEEALQQFDGLRQEV